MNMMKHFSCALALVPCLAMATSEQTQEKYFETLSNLSREHVAMNVSDDVKLLASCGDNAVCVFDNMSVRGYACLLDNLSTVIEFAGEFDAATWPTPAQSTATASFEITAELPFPAGDIDPEDYMGDYEISVAYSSWTNVLNAEITVKPVDADYEFMWFMVNFAYNGGLLGRQFPNCSKM